MSKITLSKPISAHGEEVSELELREPTGKDFRLCGVPYRIGAEEDMIIAEGPMHRMIAALAGIPESSVDMMSGRDWNRCAMTIIPLATAEIKPSRPVTTSPTSGAGP